MAIRMQISSHLKVTTTKLSKTKKHEKNFCSSSEKAPKANSMTKYSTKTNNNARIWSLFAKTSSASLSFFSSSSRWGQFRLFSTTEARDPFKKSYTFSFTADQQKSVAKQVQSLTEDKKWQEADNLFWEARSKNRAALTVDDYNAVINNWCQKYLLEREPRPNFVPKPETLEEGPFFTSEEVVSEDFPQKYSTTEEWARYCDARAKISFSRSPTLNTIFRYFEEMRIYGPLPNKQTYHTILKAVNNEIPPVLESDLLSLPLKVEEDHLWFRAIFTYIQTTHRFREAFRVDSYYFGLDSYSTDIWKGRGK